MANEHFLPNGIAENLARGVSIDGEHLTIVELVSVARYGARVRIDPRAEARVHQNRQYVEMAARQATNPGLSPQEKKDALIYGVTTGFGNLKDFPIENLEEAERLQKNILHSHAVGVGDYLPSEVVRAMMLLRINAFARGHSGVRVELLQILLAFLNHGVHPLIPAQGSVGASGDLCPLAHLALALIGKGEVLLEAQEEPKGHWHTRERLSGMEALTRIQAELQQRDIEIPFKLSFKEGLALTNGTNAMTAIGILTWYEAVNVIKHADIAGAMTLEAVTGRTRAFDAKVHQLRPHAGQVQCAHNIRQLIQGSKLIDQSVQVQDSYSVRCMPQVHGASWDALNYVRQVLETEMNAVTDNPLFFDTDPDVMDGKVNRQEYSAGNFHGQPIALALDFLAIALAELGNISERRIQKLLDAHHSNGLPMNLAVKPGLNSGLMMLQYTAAALVSENKVLAHPASVDSIPTSANAEDHVSMGTIAARKANKILAHVENVVAIELICAAQALDFRLNHLKTEANNANDVDLAARIHASLQSRTAQTAPVSQEMILAILKAQKTSQRIRIGSIHELGTGTFWAYHQIRAQLPAIDSDEKQELYQFIDRMRSLLQSGAISGEIENKIGVLYPQTWAW